MKEKKFTGCARIFLCLVMILSTGCAARDVARISADDTVDLSGRWNDTDSRLVSEEMIKDVLSRPWIDKFVKKNGTDPTVIVGTVVNKSLEHINIETFVRDLERELTNSGRVSFVASKSERDEVRDERMDQAVNSSESTAADIGQEAGANYMLKGSLNSIVDELKGKKVVFYQIDLEMVDMTSNRKVWLGQKKIKKVVNKKRFGL